MGIPCWTRTIQHYQQSTSRTFIISWHNDGLSFPALSIDSSFIFCSSFILFLYVNFISILLNPRRAPFETTFCHQETKYTKLGTKNLGEGYTQLNMMGWGKSIINCQETAYSPPKNFKPRILQATPLLNPTTPPQCNLTLFSSQSINIHTYIHYHTQRRA